MASNAVYLTVELATSFALERASLRAAVTFAWIFSLRRRQKHFNLKTKQQCQLMISSQKQKQKQKQKQRQKQQRLLVSEGRLSMGKMISLLVIYAK